MISVRLKILPSTAPVFISFQRRITKLIAFPTANIKEGKTRSVGVKPFQGACSSGAKVVAPLPGVFTIIIKQMVIPRKTSSARKRSLAIGCMDKQIFFKDRGLKTPFIFFQNFFNMMINDEDYNKCFYQIIATLMIVST